MWTRYAQCPYLCPVRDVCMSGDVTGCNTQTSVVALQHQPVSAIAPNNGDVLVYFNGQWKPSATQSTFDGDVVGQQHNLTVTALRHVPVSAQNPVENSVLVYQNGTWKPAVNAPLSFAAGHGLVVNAPTDGTTLPSLDVSSDLRYKVNYYAGENIQFNKRQKVAAGDDGITIDEYEISASAVGATGPTGPTGPVGATGPTGPVAATRLVYTWSSGEVGISTDPAKPVFMMTEKTTPYDPTVNVPVYLVPVAGKLVRIGVKLQKCLSATDSASGAKFTLYLNGGQSVEQGISDTSVLEFSDVDLPVAQYETLSMRVDTIGVIDPKAVTFIIAWVEIVAS